MITLMGTEKLSVAWPAPNFSSPCTGLNLMPAYLDLVHPQNYTLDGSNSFVQQATRRCAPDANSIYKCEQINMECLQSCTQFNVLNLTALLFSVKLSDMNHDDE